MFKSFLIVFKSLDFLNIVFRQKLIKTMPERPGTHLERCALKNWCGQVPESIRFDLYEASYCNLLKGPLLVILPVKSGKQITVKVRIDLRQFNQIDY